MAVNRSSLVLSDAIYGEKELPRGGPCDTVAVEKVLHYCSTHLWFKTDYSSYHT